MHVTGHKGGQGGGASPGDLKLSGVMLGAKEKVGGDKVENQEEPGAESLQRGTLTPWKLMLLGCKRQKRKLTIKNNSRKDGASCAISKDTLRRIVLKTKWELHAC
jgi:hypothetical protein